MPVTAGPIYPGIKDGLVFAIDPANKDSYIGTGTTVTDLKNNSITGSLLNSVGFENSSGGVFTFDGATDNIEIMDSTALKPSSITVSIWFKGGSQSTYTYLVDKYYTGSGPAYGFYTKTSADKLSFIIRKGDNTGWAETTLANSGVVMDNSWHNAVGTFSGTSLKLYIDGVYKAFGTSAGTGITYGSGPLIIGAFQSAGSLDFQGDMGPVLIYNRALSAGEILQNYNRLKGRFGLS